jgi:hypothetical protein
MHGRDHFSHMYLGGSHWDHTHSKGEKIMKKKGFGFVELSGEGMNLVNVTWPGPFQVIDIDPHFGVEILDHRNVSHWITKGNYSMLEDHTIESVLYESNTQIKVDRIIKRLGEDHRDRITICPRLKDGQNGHVHDVQEETFRIARDMVNIQGSPGNYDQDEYMRGMYNGMELILATFEGREPVYKDAPEFKPACGDGPGKGGKWGKLMV